MKGKRSCFFTVTPWRTVQIRGDLPSTRLIRRIICSSPLSMFFQKLRWKNTVKTSPVFVRSKDKKGQLFAALCLWHVSFVRFPGGWSWQQATHFHLSLDLSVFATTKKVLLWNSSLQLFKFFPCFVQSGFVPQNNAVTATNKVLFL